MVGIDYFLGPCSDPTVLNCTQQVVAKIQKIYFLYLFEWSQELMSSYIFSLRSGLYRNKLDGGYV